LPARNSASACCGVIAACDALVRTGAAIAALAVDEQERWQQ
jgi:hypothetical protein